MKMISFFFGLLLAFLHPTFSNTQVEKISHSFVVLHQDSPSLQDKSHSSNHFVDTDILELTEDETSSSEKKICTIGKTLNKSFTLVEHHFSNIFIKNSASNGYFFSLHTSLFIFLKVFRL